jgi:Cdc6-like AAA superfamily ATPase
MKKLLLLFPLCLLLANTELRAQVYVLPPIKDDTSVQVGRSLCMIMCAFLYENATSESAIELCAKKLSSRRGIDYGEALDICEERVHARAREEYKMCLLSCQY